MIDNFISEFTKYDLGLHGLKMPSFVIDEKYKRNLGLSLDCSNYDFLRKLAQNGFKKLNIEKNSELYKKYAERAKYELETLKELEFVDYIVLIWDVVNYCRENGIPTGAGRGSAAGSLILFLIDVTKIDSVKYNLYFERFISKTRAKKTIVDGVTYFDGSLFPDVDLDICYYNRHKVIEYLSEKFKGRTSKILTMNTLSGKLCIKECGKIIEEKEESEMTEVASYIPKVFGNVKELTCSYKESEKFRIWCDENPEIYKIALKLENLVKNKGVHASGYLLSSELLDVSMPVELSSDKNIISCFDMKKVGEFNVKLDLLGLRGVSVVDDCCKSLGIKFEDIDPNDDLIYQNLQDLQSSHGLFQIEAETNFKVCRKVKPKNLEELSAVLAIGRPGGISFADDYAKYVNEGILPDFDIESDKLRKILSETGGCLLYQETAMRIVHEVFELSLEVAEQVRRACGKKLRDEMLKFEKLIKEQGQKLGIPKSAEFFWTVLLATADYSFNKSHAVAYAVLSAASVYLKFKYPQHFFLSLLKMSRHEPKSIEEITKIEKELSSFGIKLLPPHLLKSKDDFSFEGPNIRFGLLSVKGISEKTIEAVKQFRGNFSTKFDVYESANKAHLNIGVLCSLIQAGCIDGFKQSRTKMVYEAQLYNILTDKEKVNVKLFGAQFDYDLVKIIKHMKETNAANGKPYIKESRIETIKKKCEKYKQIYEKNSVSEKFANWYYENNLIGYSVKFKLKEVFQEKNDELEYISEIKKLPAKIRVYMIGVVKETKNGVSREKKTKYLKMNVSDETGETTVMVFKDKIEQNEDLNGKSPEKDDIVIVKGRWMGDAIFADLVAIQNQKIYTKLSQLKKDSSEEKKLT